MTLPAEQSTTPSKLFPGPVRARPEYFIADKGRYGVYYLVDHLFRGLAWGSPREAMGDLSIAVATDGTLKLTRHWTGAKKLFAGLEGDLSPGPGESLAGHHFLRCVAAIKSGQYERLAWVDGNPFASIFLPLAIALSSKAKLTLTSQEGTFQQSYRAGEPVATVSRSSGGAASVALELLLDQTVLQEEIPSYPLRIRLRELASLMPGLKISLQYKGFKTVQFLAEEGTRELLEFYIPKADRLHPEPFHFHYSEGPLQFRCSLFLTHSEMERLKTFAGLDESYHGGTHETLFRDIFLTVFRQIHKFEVPERRQSVENIASSRMTYFGTFGATIPYSVESRPNQFVGTIPGLAAVVHLDAPSLAWETNHRGRLLEPKVDDSLRTELHFQFRKWVLDNSETITTWKEQWIPKSRKKRSAVSEKKEEETEE